MKVLGPHRVNDGTGPPKLRHACIPNQRVQTLSCTRARTQTHILPAVHSFSLYEAVATLKRRLMIFLQQQYVHLNESLPLKTSSSR